MKYLIIRQLSKLTSLSEQELENLVEVPKSPEMGDFAFPCFVLAKSIKKSPAQISQELASKIDKKEFEKIEARGPYLNFFLKKSAFASEVIKKILKEKDRYGSSKIGREKTIAIDLSSPNIAKPFGIGHLRSTIIGNSISNISKFLGYKTIKINYLGDWGTQFGKLILAYKKWGDKNKLSKNSISYLQELYVKISGLPELEDDAREEFRKLEEGDKENLQLWKLFKEISLKEFDKIYKILEIKFDAVSGESFYNNEMDAVVAMLKKKGILKESEGAKIVDLKNFGLGVCLITKKDGSTLYATRDIAAAIDRHKKYNFDKMIYETGTEQNLHFKQLFKVLELAGFFWAKNCIHVAHGLYLDSDGKKFSTREGKTIYMRDILTETINLARQEIKKRERLSAPELDKRAKSIALSAIIYGDLKNYRENDMIFDMERFVAFEGNTGTYLLYTYARANSILAKKKAPPKFSIPELKESEGQIILKLNEFPEVILKSYEHMAPNLIANYTYSLAQQFNEWYHSCKVIGSEQEGFRLNIVFAVSQVLRNSLLLLGIPLIKRM